MRKGEWSESGRSGARLTEQGGEVTDGVAGLAVWGLGSARVGTSGLCTAGRAQGGSLSAGLGEPEQPTAFSLRLPDK